MRTVMMVTLCVFLTLGCMSFAFCIDGESSIAEQSPFYRQAKMQARLLPIHSLGARKIVIDGDVADWGDMRQDSYPIQQLLDHTVPEFHQSWKRQWEHTAIDASLIKLLYDQDALYVAIQVADDSVISPAANRLGGDVVDMYLDLRPLTGDGPTLGHCKFTEGVYQLVFAPPSGNDPVYILQPDGELLTDWRPGQKVPRLGPFEAKGQLFPGGYTIEIRLPLSSFPHKPPVDRFARPIGFEVMIADKDTARPDKQPDRLYYSCSGYNGNKEYFKSPSMLACTDPDLRTSLPLSRLSNNPLKRAPGGDECEGWIVTDIGEKNLAAAFHAASKAVAGYMEPAVAPAWPDESFTTYPCKALGLAFHHRRVLSHLPALCPSCVGNRYTAVLPAEGQKIKIDGVLDDWGDLARGASLLYEYGNLTACSGLPGRTDAATVKLMTDHDTLYIAVRVQDDAVSNPGGQEKRFAGDEVQLFLDVRPPNGGLSSDGYRDGVYQFTVAPPTADGQPAAITQGSQQVRRAGPVDFASTLLKDGYAVELAIPLASLLDNPVPGRFEQPFGFEALVVDIDRPGADGQYAPLLTYSWGGADEKTLQGTPSRFNCTDYTLNRMPEIRALVDDTPVAITADFTRKLQNVSGFGGNLYHDMDPLPHTIDGRDGRYALSSFNSLYVAEHTNTTWLRANVHLYPWGELEKDWKQLIDNPIGKEITARKLMSIPQPMEYLIATVQHPDNSDTYYRMTSTWYLTMLKPWVQKDTRLCFYADSLPPKLLSKTKDGQTTIVREMWPAYAECINSYMRFAKKVFGIEFTYFAIKDVPRGDLYFSEQDYLDLLKFLGASFENQGFNTKLLLCDTAASYDFRWYCNTGVVNNQEVLKYIGAVGVELAGSVETNLATYRLWSDLATTIDRPLVITSFGRPYAASTTYLFDEVRIWQQIMRELKPQAALVKQFVAEKSSQWLMVYGKNIVQDPNRNLPTLTVTNIAGKEEDAVPTLRYWFAKQFCDLTPAGQAVQTKSDHPQVLVTGFTGKLDGRDVQTLHISNAGPARHATLAGLPNALRTMRIVRSGAGEGFANAGNIELKNGKATLELPAWSLVTLTTMPIGR